MPLRSDRLRQLREARQFTQEELAERAGLKLRMIQRYEAGESQPTIDAASSLATALDTTSDYLAGATDDPTPRLIYEELSAEERALIVAVRNRQSAKAIQALAIALAEDG